MSKQQLKEWDREFQEQMKQKYYQEYEDFNVVSNQYTTWN